MTVLSAAMGIVAAIGFGLSACGGGGGGSSITSSSSTSTSSSASSSSSITGAAANVVTAEVDGGPAGVNAVDTLFVTVTICTPGTNTCQSIPNVQVDTGSYGLRIIYEALTPAQWTTLGLTQEVSGGKPVAECAQWADGYSWGPVVTADVEIASERGSNVPVHVLEGTTYSPIPTECNNNGPNGEEDTVATFGANGILGVGPFVRDCGPACAPPNAAIKGTYYDCAFQAATCDDPTDQIAVAQNLQISNPVAYFATDNNGVIVELPAISANGAATATGVLVFGIGTQTNNMVGGATVFGATSEFGTITTVFSDDTSGQTTLTGSYFDTGSNGNFFTDSNLPMCTMDTGFFCPATTQSFMATVQGASGTPSEVFDFEVGNADNLTTVGTAAFNDLAGSLPATQNNSPAGGVFDWGLPFFFGENVFVAITCASQFDSGVSSCEAAAPFFAVIGN